MTNHSDLLLSSELATLPRCDDHTDHAYSSSPNRCPSVLGVLISKQDSCLLERIATAQGWALILAGSWTDAIGLAEGYRLGVVLMPRDILSIDWREGLQLFLQPSHRSKVLLVTSTPLDDFCHSFVEQGGFEILSSPLQETQVLDQVQHAWASWKHSVAGPYAY